MLQAIRDRVTGVVAFLILGLLAIPFLFFGVDSYIRDVPQDAVAEIGDEQISANEFQAEFSRYRAQLRQQQGDAYDDLATNQPQARREFLDQMIDQRLLANHARELGLAISPNALLEVIQGIPAFQVDGRFDPQVYGQRLRASGQTVGRFEQELTRDLLIQELPTAVSASGFVTDDAVNDWLRIQQQQRDVALVDIDSQPFRESISVSDEQIESYYADNTGQFMRPERIAVEYIELDTRDMVGSMDVAEDELRERYDAVKSRFMAPEERRAAHILIAETDERDAEAARALARSLRDRINDGEAFADLAEEYSDDPVSADDGGDLGWVEPGVMDAPFEDALYALEQGAVSDPVQTDFGWHLIRLDDVRPPRGQSFDEARDEILQDMRAERADDLYIELSDRLVDLIYADPTGLEAIAEDLDLERKVAGPFSRQGAEGVLAEPRVLEAAFSDMVLQDRQASEPIELDRNHAIVIRVTEYEPAEPRPLDDVRDEIRGRLEREAAQEAAREYGQQLIARINDEGVSLQEVAEQEELEFRERVVTRRDFDLGGPLLDGVFSLRQPQGDAPTLELVARGSGWSLVELRSVEDGDPAAVDDAQRRSARQQLEFAYTGREVQGLLAWLRENTEINVADDRLQ